jgi:hypothetical protein
VWWETRGRLPLIGVGTKKRRGNIMKARTQRWGNRRVRGIRGRGERPGPGTRAATWSVAQRLAAYEPQSDGGGKYVRIGKDHSRGGGAGEGDAKMMALNMISHLIEAELTSMGKSGAPHIAVSVVGKHMLVAVNTSRAGGGPNLPSSAELKTAATRATQKVAQRASMPVPMLQGAHTAGKEALMWVSNIPNGVTAFGYDGMVATPNPAGAPEHGEQRITRHLVEDPGMQQMLRDRQHKLAMRLSWGDEYLRSVRIGGTKADCAFCHEQHHGAVIGTIAGTTRHKHAAHQGVLPGFKTNDARLQPLDHRVMSPGTSGRQFGKWGLQRGGATGKTTGVATTTMAQAPNWPTRARNPLNAGVMAALGL